jgi:hypothetical protein
MELFGTRQGQVSTHHHPVAFDLQASRVRRSLSQLASYTTLRVDLCIFY